MDDRPVLLQPAVVTCVGAYAVPTCMAQHAIQGFGRLSTGEMAGGPGLAETVRCHGIDAESALAIAEYSKI